MKNKIEVYIDIDPIKLARDLVLRFIHSSFIPDYIKKEEMAAVENSDDVLLTHINEYIGVLQEAKEKLEEKNHG
jgi:hypothetical protein